MTLSYTPFYMFHDCLQTKVSPQQAREETHCGDKDSRTREEARLLVSLSADVLTRWGIGFGKTEIETFDPVNLIV